MLYCSDPPFPPIRSQQGRSTSINSGMQIAMWPKDLNKDIGVHRSEDIIYLVLFSWNDLINSLFTYRPRQMNSLPLFKKGY